MTWLLRITVRLTPLRKLKARRTELLLDKSHMLWRTKLEPASLNRTAIAEARDEIRRIDAQLDAINAEIGRRGR